MLDLLSQALGVANGRPRSNGLGRFAGTWSEEEFEEFEEAISDTERIDPELWR